MHRAKWIAFGVAAFTILLPPHAARSIETLMNGVGILDYTHKPVFKVGDWVRYRVTGANTRGETVDYNMTVVIGGEQRFWGEDCFWVETWTLPNDGTSAQGVATLMSYAIFADSAAIPRMKLYMRKQVNDVDIDGNPVEVVLKRPPLSLRSRQPPSERLTWDYDTVGVDTVVAPKGVFRGAKVQMRDGVAVTSEKPDSTLRTELMETRTIFFDDRIPLTRIAREVIEQTTHKQMWAVGRSREGTGKILAGRSTGESRVDDYGHGLEPQITPVRYRKSIREQEGAATKPKTGGKSG